MKRNFQNTALFRNLTRVEAVLEEDSLTKTATLLACQRGIAKEMFDALAALDAWWTAEWPGGPDTDDIRILRLSDETIAIWRAIRAALAKADFVPAMTTEQAR